MAERPDLLVVALELRCIECHRFWQVPSERWRVYLTDDDPPKAVAYCPHCAEREFGSQ
jgi:hypothetical protein